MTDVESKATNFKAEGNDRSSPTTRFISDEAVLITTLPDDLKGKLNQTMKDGAKLKYILASYKCIVKERLECDVALTWYARSSTDGPEVVLLACFHGSGREVFKECCKVEGFLLVSF